MKKRFSLFGIFLPIIFLATMAMGQTITSVSGTIAQGNTMTIGGSGFGTKTTAAPFKYDDFHFIF